MRRRVKDMPRNQQKAAMASMRESHPSTSYNPLKIENNNLYWKSKTQKQKAIKDYDDIIKASKGMMAMKSTSPKEKKIHSKIIAEARKGKREINSIQVSKKELKGMTYHQPKRRRKKRASPKRTILIQV